MVILKGVMSAVLTTLQTQYSHGVIQYMYYYIKVYINTAYCALDKC